MADEAFALSPISARPVQPSEADYEAIREAFMETSRGRWFLGEYAKRNRNSDTAMVLDAVARIEQALAAQRQEPERDDGFAVALGAIRSAVEEAAKAASAALAELKVQEELAPIHKGTRIINEISWRWREIGADGRICDLIDKQVAAIEASCARIAAADAKGALSAAFDLIRRRLDEFDELGAPPATSENVSAEEVVAAASSLMEAAATRSDPAPGAAEPATEITFAAPADAEAAAAAPEEAPAETAAANIERAETSAADAHDEAVLEMIAIEMAAPDPVDDGMAEDVAEAHATAPPVIEPIPVSTPDHESQARLEASASSEPPQISSEPAAMGAQPSLGSTIIATGILQRPKVSSDPLAPIRRMSQAEKIAFFS